MFILSAGKQKLTRSLAPKLLRFACFLTRLCCTQNFLLSHSQEARSKMTIYLMSNRINGHRADRCYVPAIHILRSYRLFSGTNRLYDNTAAESFPVCLWHHATAGAGADSESVPSLCFCVSLRQFASFCVFVVVVCVSLCFAGSAVVQGEVSGSVLAVRPQHSGVRRCLACIVNSQPPGPV